LVFLFYQITDLRSQKYKTLNYVTHENVQVGTT